ncbi:MAG: phosphoglycerate dehydrogenase [Armatimonadetes bacterium]|nr:phosphoglycerate dehydrogenase [Armatimonadota bacterium]
MAKILVCDNVAREGVELLAAHEVVEARGWSRDEVLAAVADADALMVRSGTRVDAEMIETGAKLRVIARAGVGVDNIDVAAATRRGIAVVNTPTGNTISAAEHTLGMMLAAARKIPLADAAMKAGEWPKSECLGRQLYGKTLGVVGLGRIGQEVARRARAFEMRLLGCDPYVTEERAAELGVRLVALEELLAEADVVTLHAALTDESRHLIGAEEFALMRDGALLVNCARGGLVDESALKEALRSGRLAAAALDVFEGEPEPDAELVGLPNVVATPHVAASTEEAQVHVAREAALQVLDVLEGGRPRWPVNVPALGLEEQDTVGRFVPLAEHIGRLHAALLDTAPQQLTLEVHGPLAAEHLEVLMGHVLAGLLERIAEEDVNYVNAPLIADERGIRHDLMRLLGDDDAANRQGYSEFVSVTITDANGERTVSGALLDRYEPHIVNVGGFEMDLPPRNTVLLVWNGRPEAPGFVGRIGVALGEAGISILGLQVALEVIDGVGLMAVTLGEPVSPEVLETVASLPDIVRTRMVEFPA